MCGRFALDALAAILIEEFGIDDVRSGTEPRFNIAPTQMSPVVLRQEGKAVMDVFRWGLVPSWAKDASIGNKMINARAESVAEKPSFRAAFQKRRCLVPATGFFEWKTTPAGKAPYHIRLASGRPFAFAGLWEVWNAPDGTPLRTFTIITCGANRLVADIHDRMPVIVPRDKRMLWLGAGVAAGRHEILSVLAPYPEGEMEAYEVSKLVNSPSNNSPECTRPV